MKKFFILSLFAMFLVTGTASVVHTVNDNVEAAEKYNFLCAASLLLGANVARSSNLSFGFVPYFSEMDANPLSRAEKALWDYLTKRADAQIVQDLREGKLVIEKYARNLRFIIPISSGGRRELLNASSVYAQGRIPQEWHQGQLPKGTTIAIDSIRLGFATDAAITTPQGDIDYGSITDSWPAALRNAELIISQRGAVKGGAMDCNYMGSKAAGFQSAVRTDGLLLEKPMILESDAPTKIELFSPDGVTFAATPANQFLEISILGAWFRMKQ